MPKFKIRYVDGAPDTIEADKFRSNDSGVLFYKNSEIVADVSRSSLASIIQADVLEAKPVRPAKVLN